MKYFSFNPDHNDPDNGILRFHRTAAGAKKAAQENLIDQKEDSLVGWDCRADEVCWGKISEIATETGRSDPRENERVEMKLKKP